MITVTVVPRQMSRSRRSGDLSADVTTYAEAVSQTGRKGKGGDAGAHSLTASGPSQLGILGSMRARDVSRPTEEQHAAAEALVQVSYRGPAQPPGSGGSSPVSS
jgi:hypothetical protein